MADHGEQDKDDNISVEQRERLDTSVKSSQLLKEGELTKLGAGWRVSWRKRWFQLTEDAIAYHDKKGGKIKGGVLLETVTMVRVASSAETKKPNAFVVDTNTGRTYVIQGSSDDERDEWIAAIDKAVMQHKARRGEAVAAAPAAPAEKKEVDDAKPPVLVLGASGNVGKATLAALAAKGVRTRAGVRDPSSSKAKKLADLDGVEVVKADMASPETLAAALDGVSAVFVVTPGAENRADLVAEAVKAAKDAGAPHLVAVSLPSVDAEGDILFKAQFAAIEATVKDSGVPFTILRLPMFVDNQWAAQDTIQSQGTIYGPADPAKPASLITVGDVGEAAAAVLASPADHAGKTYTLAGDTLTFADVASRFADATGRDLSYVRVPYEAAIGAMTGMGFPEWQGKGIAELLQLVDAGEASVFETKELEALLGRPPTTVAAWVAGVAGAFKPVDKIKVYYWPIFGRAGAILRMLDEAQVPYDRVTDMEGLASMCSCFGGHGTTFAPPVVVDGDQKVAQSVAASVYIGQKVGFAPAVEDEHKALQYMLDVVDTFENGLYKSDESGAKMRAFIEGDGGKPSRFTMLAGNIERQITGPFYFGESPTTVDFFLSAVYENVYVWGIRGINEATKSDVFAPFPKIKGVVAGIKALPNAKDYTEALAAQVQKFGLETKKPDFFDEYVKAGEAAPVE